MRNLIILVCTLLTIGCGGEQSKPVVPNYTPEQLTCFATAELLADAALAKCAGGPNPVKCPKKSRDVIEAQQTKESLECLH